MTKTNMEIRQMATTENEAVVEAILRLNETIERLIQKLIVMGNV